jgi:transposase-like protein
LGALLCRSSACPALGVVGVLVDGGKQLLALELCAGESFAAWKGCLDDLAARGLQAPVLAIDGNAGLRRAVGLVWPKAAVQRCCVHELRNLERQAPKHALAETRDDFHRIVYAANADTARTAYAALERT